MLKLVLLSLLMVSCSTLQDLVAPQTLKPDPKTIYRYDMKLSVNGVVGTGVLVVRKAAKYDIEIESKEAMDLLTIRSCHREMVIENVNEKYGWAIFGTKRRNGKVSFVPQTLELYDCPMELTGYSKATGKHSFGFINYENDEDKLPATLKCDGNVYQAMGVSACSSRYGLYQEIEFATKVVIYPELNCPLSEVVEERMVGKRFIFPIIKGECHYVFKEEKGDKTHSLRTVGYQEILVRSAE
jgi:hypothetical protein